MKKIILLSSVLFLFAQCKDNGATTTSPEVIENPTDANGNIDTTNGPKIVFETLDHDFGTITEGDVVEFTYKFKNTGNSDLVISNTSVSCGCTVPSKTEKPVKPREEGFVKASFNSAGKQGMQNKTVTVTSNSVINAKIELKFSANVSPKSQQ